MDVSRVCMQYSLCSTLFSSTPNYQASPCTTLSWLLLDPQLDHPLPLLEARYLDSATGDNWTMRPWVRFPDGLGLLVLVLVLNSISATAGTNTSPYVAAPPGLSFDGTLLCVGRVRPRGEISKTCNKFINRIEKRALFLLIFQIKLKSRP